LQRSFLTIRHEKGGQGARRRKQRGGERRGRYTSNLSKIPSFFQNLPERKLTRRKILKIGKIGKIDRKNQENRENREKSGKIGKIVKTYASTSGIL
jgi:hypothetical protein